MVQFQDTLVKGFYQQTGFDFTKTFSPVVQLVKNRVVLTNALARGWQIRQIDINNAFLNGILQEDVLMQQPLDSEQYNQQVCKLHKALYGLKQSPRAQFENFQSSLLQLGFASCKSRLLIVFQFTTKSCVIAVVHVDDIIITRSDSPELTKLISCLNVVFSLKDLGKINYVLGIQVQHIDYGLHLSQKKYITDLLQKVNMLNSKPLPTPMISSLQLSSLMDDLILTSHEYRNVVRALQYTTITQPKIFYNVHKVCQFMHLLDTHWKVVKRVLRCQNSTVEFSLSFTIADRLGLIGYLNADQGGNLDDRRSTIGFCVYFGHNIIL